MNADNAKIHQTIVWRSHNASASLGLLYRTVTNNPLLPENNDFPRPSQGRRTTMLGIPTLRLPVRGRHFRT